jgi:hypothetical protein
MSSREGAGSGRKSASTLPEGEISSITRRNRGVESLVPQKFELLLALLVVGASLIVLTTVLTAYDDDSFSILGILCCAMWLRRVGAETSAAPSRSDGSFGWQGLLFFEPRNRVKPWEIVST